MRSQWKKKQRNLHTRLFVPSHTASIRTISVIRSKTYKVRIRGISVIRSNTYKAHIGALGVFADIYIKYSWIIYSKLYITQVLDINM